VCSQTLGTLFAQKEESDILPRYPPYIGFRTSLKYSLNMQTVGTSGMYKKRIWKPLNLEVASGLNCALKMIRYPSPVGGKKNVIGSGGPRLSEVLVVSTLLFDYHYLENKTSYEEDAHNQCYFSKKYICSGTHRVTQSSAGGGGGFRRCTK
jgi:hypothetical protein